MDSFRTCIGRKKKSPGDLHASMEHSWLADVNAAGGGAHYQYMKAFVQAAAGFMVGIGFDADGDSGRAHLQALGVIFLQVGLAMWVLLKRPAGDRIEGWVAGLEALFCGIGVLLLYIGGIYARNAAVADEGDGRRLAQSTSAEEDGPGQLQNYGLLFSVLSVCTPLLLVFYDQIVLPLVACLTVPAAPGGKKKSCCDTIYGIIVFIPSVFCELCGGEGFGSSLFGVVVEVEGGVKESAEDIYTAKRIDKELSKGALPEPESPRSPKRESVSNPMSFV